MILIKPAKAQYGCDICGVLITPENQCIGGDEVYSVNIKMPWDRGGIGNTIQMTASKNNWTFQGDVAFCKTCVGKELIRQTKD